MEHTLSHIDSIEEALTSLKEQLIEHPLYHKITSIEALRIFTNYHAFAVWDFMSLLKSLQQGLTSTTLPWRPVGDPTTRYLINEIVTGEESDVDENGNRCSHYELYMSAMEELGSNREIVEGFVSNAITSEDIFISIIESNLPDFVKEFLQFTFDIAYNAPLHIKAAVFTFGREDLIPGMFISMVRELYQDNPDKLSIFKYYLERHIEVDGDEHSLLGKQMVEHLCGNEDQKWNDAKKMSIKGLEMRKILWDGIESLIENENNK